MRDFDFKQFYDNLKKDLTEANRVIADVENDEWADMHSSPDERAYDDEEKDFNKERLTDILEAVKLKIEFAYEYIGLSKMRERLDKDLAEYSGRFGDLAFISYIDVFYSPVSSILGKHLNALTSHEKMATDSEFEKTNSTMLLEQMLRGTPKLLFDRQIEPASESEVRNEVYNHLILVFPDTVREIPISKVSKTYKPDIGIKRIKSAIEYKFVDSPEEAKTAIGGIFEDIKGYEGSEDWTTFYAVIYMTNNFLTQDQVDAEFKLSNVPHTWKPIVVFGMGSRIKKNLNKKIKNSTSVKKLKSQKSKRLKIKK